jgi:hypothetical protein
MTWALHYPAWPAANATHEFTSCCLPDSSFPSPAHVPDVVLTCNFDHKELQVTSENWIAQEKVTSCASIWTHDDVNFMRRSPRARTDSRNQTFDVKTYSRLCIIIIIICHEHFQRWILGCCMYLQVLETHDKKRKQKFAVPRDTTCLKIHPLGIDQICKAEN